MVNETTVYVLQHTRTAAEYEDVKLLGVYSSREEAQAAIERLRRQPGFVDHQAGFHIDAYPLDRDCWTSGFGVPHPEADRTA